MRLLCLHQLGSGIHDLPWKGEFLCESERRACDPSHLHILWGSLHAECLFLIWTLIWRETRRDWMSGGWNGQEMGAGRWCIGIRSTEGVVLQQWCPANPNPLFRPGQPSQVNVDLCQWYRCCRFKLAHWASGVFPQNKCSFTPRKLFKVNTPLWDFMEATLAKLHCRGESSAALSYNLLYVFPFAGVLLMKCHDRPVFLCDCIFPLY